MRLLVATAGSFQLRVEDTGELIRHYGYTVVRPSAFITARISLDQIEVIARVNDEATDAEWLNYVRECGDDLDMAVAAFEAAFPANGPVVDVAAANEPAKPTKPAKSARAAA